MKKLLKGVLLITTALLCFTSCQYMSSRDNNKSTKQVYVTQEMLDSILNRFDNPEFQCISDVVEYYEQEKSWRAQDSVFFSLSPEKLRNAATVVLKAGDPITPANIANEYLHNKHVYDNLFTPNPNIEALAANEQYTREKRDTVIGGKHVTIVIEEDGRTKVEDAK